MEEQPSSPSQQQPRAAATTNPFAQPKRKMGPMEKAARKALREDHARRQAEDAERLLREPLPKYVPKPVAGCHVFFHPDLGIGGAERLVVDAAVGLQDKGAKVVIYTNYCDPHHCFDECRNGTLDVRVKGSWLIPRSFFGRFTILCAILRQVHLLLHIWLTGELEDLKPAIFIVDQLSAGLPWLRLLVSPKTGIVFYCHFPDLLLVQGRHASLLKRLYRIPFDRLEEWSMGFADAVALNSNFTKSIVQLTWPELLEHTTARVIYPCVDTESKEDDLTDDGPPLFPNGDRVLLSINRFERKKDIGLAIRAFASIPDNERRGVRLVIAGGYDRRVAENVEYHRELESLANECQLAHDTINTADNPTARQPGDTSAPVLFLLSVPHDLKRRLLRAAALLVYTPANEHFGIVPLEAMLAQVPVLAANTGGPTETVVEAETGWLRDPYEPLAWSAVMRRALGLPAAEAQRMGAEGRRRVKETFGRDHMATTLMNVVRDIVVARRDSDADNTLIIVVVGTVFSLILAGLSLGIALWMMHDMKKNATIQEAVRML
ncbi:mannosyltransferase [Cordyceps militaris CM01]|uniref:Alpha-1,3/1,6-mannosyltransferase ALG2 n=1 Tax=Cordyceps militaris (strain CM01) TaxID=983644 RepID=G3JCD3_CORMM|nr:mannosyltransferase [Cordyceps militaris CM01]EGX93798.1 mannosyltransferase [Cordyceps militaris CM01]